MIGVVLLIKKKDNKRNVPLSRVRTATMQYLALQHTLRARRYQQRLLEIRDARRACTRRSNQ